MAANRDDSAHDIERDKPNDPTSLEDCKQVDTGNGKGPPVTDATLSESAKKADIASSENAEQRDTAAGHAPKQDGESIDKPDETDKQADVDDGEIPKQASDVGHSEEDKVGDDNVHGQPGTDEHATAQEDDATDSDPATNPFHPWVRKIDADRDWPFWYNVQTGAIDWVKADLYGNPLPIPDYGNASSSSAYNGEYGNAYNGQYGNAYTGQYGNAYSGQYGDAYNYNAAAYTTGAYAAAAYATSGTDAASSPAKPKRLYGGYNPAIHGSYDPNADYAKEAEREEEEAETARRAAELAAAGVPPPGAAISVQAHFNQVHGRFQDSSMNPELHNDENKSHRQMNAFFDVNTAANQHDGRSLKEERRHQKLNKQQLQYYKKREADRRKEKLRKFWME